MTDVSKAIRETLDLVSKLRDEVSRLAAERDALAEQAKRARNDALEEAARAVETCDVSATLAPTVRIAAAIRALRGATDGADT